LTGCDASCPTPNQYPDLAPQKIAEAWRSKHRLLKSQHLPIILGNSNWSVKIANEVLELAACDDKSKLAKIRLGAPAHLFKPMQRSNARAALGIDLGHFVIAFSVSVMSDERKGGTYLLEALHGLDLPNVSVLLIGHLDQPIEIKGVQTISLGYISKSADVVAALSAANVYVGPSIEETFGQVFIEASLVGTPSIGFNQTGVVDAIVDGVTGLRVECSVQALREGILRLYYDRKLCDSLGHWAHIYAANEFSLESSYRSLFTVWRASGLVDSCQLPHKIGFVRQSAFVDDSFPLSADEKCRGIKGVSALEGPYPPDIPSTFWWCYGAETIIKLDCGAGGRQRVRLKYYSPLFDVIKIAVYVNDFLASEVRLHETDFGKADVVDILINAQSGWNVLKLMPNRVREPTDNEKKALTFMLQEIEIIGVKNENKMILNGKQ
jgi:hypothetical protein